MTIRQLAPVVLFPLLALAHCTPQEGTAYVSREVHHSTRLTVEQLSPNAFVHTSYKQTQDFGNVPCNGLVVRNGGEAIVSDTPTNDSAAAELIRWVQYSLPAASPRCPPTHFHDDCLAGLKAFHAHGIPSYAHQHTITLAAAGSVEVPLQAFTDSLQLNVGKKHITATIHGEGHTRHNVVGYLTS